jgi:hypothetical protein
MGYYGMLPYNIRALLENGRPRQFWEVKSSFRSSHPNTLVNSGSHT